MKKTNLFALAMVCGAWASNGAVLVYDNTFNPSPFPIAATGEYGDQISLFTTDAQEVIGYDLTRFGLEYFANVLNGGEEIKIRFYQNDGAPQGTSLLPGTLFFESAFQPIEIGEGNLVTLNLENVSAPTSFTYTVEFRGLSLGEDAGLNLYSPPVIGSSTPSYWQRDVNGIFQEIDNQGFAIDFGAFVEGTPVVVPEPATTSFLLLGSLGFAAYLRSRKRS